ncbi:MAG: response regulator [Chloroflexaceae bacterium]
MTTIVLADDHPMVLHGLRAVLEAEPDFTIIGEATEGHAVLDMVLQLQPEILILDVLMPGLNGMELTQQLTSHGVSTRIVIFSMHANTVYVRETLRHGASAYVLKESDAGDLVHAVREVLAGRRFLSRALTERAVDMFLEFAAESSLDWVELLTSRERQVLHLAAQGASNAEIGNRLNISPRTAETHRTNLMRKLGLKTQAELLRYAMQHGIVEHPDGA